MTLIAYINDVTSTVLLVHLTLLQVAAFIDVQVEGELAFDLRVPNRANGKGRWYRVGWEVGSEVNQELVLRSGKQNDADVTAAPLLECVYQYPERKQVDALLSNIMNELTKLFLQFDEYKLKKQDPTRFRVVHEKQKRFFDRVYKDMADKFGTFSNDTFKRGDHLRSDPCAHQQEAKRMWTELLQRGQYVLRTALQQCYREYVKITPMDKERIGILRRYLAMELKRLRTKQLNMLCATYQLCYNELLK